jgi:hypothetical protein
MSQGKYSFHCSEECYLCGKPITIDRTLDHVPPKQFYAPELRQKFSLNNLITLPTHRSCNESFGLDEEYVVNTFVPLAIGSIAANTLFQHHAVRIRSGKAVYLSKKIFQSFDKRPSGLYLPRGLVLMRVEGDRVKRIIWKIVRGLYMIEYGSILTETTSFMIEIKEPENKGPSCNDDLWEAVKAQQSKGVYQGVFTYKHLNAKADHAVIYLWGMLWWDRIMVLVAHGEPLKSSI